MLAWILIFLLACGSLTSASNVKLKPPDTREGYLARLLINEVPFPGEHGWLSESDTKSAMLQILWVLDSRINRVPAGYRQTEVAAVRTKDIIDVITVGGEKGQCDGFYKDSNGRFVSVPRVQERIDYLSKIAGDGKPGRFARLLNYGQDLANAYMKGGVKDADRFAALNQVQDITVTGRGYSWMSDKDYYKPGGDFVKIPNEKEGALGGNRFFTLKERK